MPISRKMPLEITEHRALNGESSRTKKPSAPEAPTAVRLGSRQARRRGSRYPAISTSAPPRSTLMIRLSAPAALGPSPCRRINAAVSQVEGPVKRHP